MQYKQSKKFSTTDITTNAYYLSFIVHNHVLLLNIITSEHQCTIQYKTKAHRFLLFSGLDSEQVRSADSNHPHCLQLSHQI